MDAVCSSRADIICHRQRIVHGAHITSIAHGTTRESAGFLAAPRCSPPRACWRLCDRSLGRAGPAGLAGVHLNARAVNRRANAACSWPSIWPRLGPARMEAMQRDVTASGVRVRVAERGDGAHVVLLHDLFVDGTSWSEVGGELARDFHVVIPDLPGFGSSEKPSPTRFPYGVDAFVESVADLYAGLSLGRAAVVGHGLGGAVALSLAARHPELVAR